MYKENRSLPEFNRVTLKGLGNVYLATGDEQSFSIDSNQDLSNKVKTEVFNNELIISFHDIFPVWLVTMPKLDFHITMKTFFPFKEGYALLRSEIIGNFTKMEGDVCSSYSTSASASAVPHEAHQ